MVRASRTHALEAGAEDQLAWRLRHQERPTREQAVAESANNLHLQLAIEDGLRSGWSRSYATGMNPNPRLWKYHWFVFVSPPNYDGSAKHWTYAMPAMIHAEFVRRWLWLEENEIQFFFGNGRTRRQHPVWREDIVAAGGLAPAYDDDLDAVASDGHR